MNAMIFSLMGGCLIGIAVTLMLLFNGKVTGVSGIIAASMSKPNKEGAWRMFFLFGLLVGGILMKVIRPESFANFSDRGIPMVLFAGLFVGFGTVMGSGCTSGHGVCGVSRLSLRSVTATFTFMFFGFLTVQIVRHFLGGGL